MHAWIRRALCAVGLTGGIVLLGIGLAEASSADGTSGPHTTGESGILSGNQTAVDAQAPINLSGNQVTVIGQHNHATSAGASSTGTGGGGSAPASPTTSGEHGIGSGNQTAVDAQAPINVSGNQVTVIGQDNDVKSAGASATPGGGAPSSSPTTSGAHGIASGNQTAIGVLAPIDVSGNQVTVIGQGNDVKSAGASATPGGGGAGTATTTGAGGLLSGNQTALGIALPINASGNQVTVIGQDNTNTSAGATTTGGGGSGAATGGATTSGANGAVSGNQTGIAVLAPIAATGNQVTVVGEDNTNTSTGGSTSDGGTTSPPGTTTGGGTTSPPGGVVSPPTGGTSGGPAPGASVLPDTGAGSGLGAVALLGLLLVLAGSAILGRRGTSVW
ncbi:MAG TPA: chaplin family protein [Marmoricola sp.]|nr:chaplin family protein [Marmoricola sp.]